MFKKWFISQSNDGENQVNTNTKEKQIPSFKFEAEAVLRDLVRKDGDNYVSVVQTDNGGSNYILKDISPDINKLFDKIEKENKLKMSLSDKQYMRESWKRMLLYYDGHVQFEQKKPLVRALYMELLTEDIIQDFSINNNKYEFLNKLTEFYQYIYENVVTQGRDDTNLKKLAKQQFLKLCAYLIYDNKKLGTDKEIKLKILNLVKELEDFGILENSDLELINKAYEETRFRQPKLLKHDRGNNGALEATDDLNPNVHGLHGSRHILWEDEPQVSSATKTSSPLFFNWLNKPFDRLSEYATSCFTSTLSSVGKRLEKTVLQSPSYFPNIHSPVINDWQPSGQLLLTQFQNASFTTATVPSVTAPAPLNRVVGR